MERQNIKYYLAGLASLITCAVYLTSLNHQFVEWDDSLYVFENLHIRALNVIFLKWAFFDFYASNWHPLTWISHALDYSLWGLNPLGHHLTNIILHAVNTFIVVLLVVRLIEAARSMQPSSSEVVEQPSNDSTTQHLNLSPFTLIAATVTGLLFGLHPLHVESVAWVAERKDLLCALFFLLSILAYVRYAANIPQSAKRIEHRTNNIYFAFTQRALLFALCFFILALMSKPMAVSLPVVLLILDWYPFKRITSLRTFLNACIEKIPFILLSLASSILTIMAQRSGEAMALTEIVPLQTRLFIAIRSYFVYLRKTLFPLDLLPFYPYPAEVAPLSPEYLLPILFVTAVTVVTVAAAKRRGVWLSIWGYYVVTLIPVVGIVQVGGQAMADRYTYLPALGPFVAVGVGAAWVFEKARTLKIRGLITAFSVTAALLLLATMAYLTFNQIRVWKNTVVLWSYVIEMGTVQVPNAYNNRGLAFYDEGRFDQAIEDFNRSIALNPAYAQAYNNRGLAFSGKDQPDQAIEDFNKSIALNPAFYGTYNNRGLILMKKGLLDAAIKDFSTAILTNPSLYSAYNNRAQAYMKLGRLDTAIEDFSMSIALNPFHEVFYSRGMAFERKGENHKAIEDYQKALAMNPAYLEAYIRLGVLYGKEGLFDRAIEYFDKAITVNPQFALAYGNRGFAHSLMGQYDKALQDLNKAIELDKAYSSAYFNRGNVYLKRGEKGRATLDFQKVCELGDREGCAMVKAVVSR